MWVILTDAVETEKWTVRASLQTRAKRKKQKPQNVGTSEQEGQVEESGKASKREEEPKCKGMFEGDGQTDKQWRWEGIKQRRAGQQGGGGGGGGGSSSSRRKDRMLTRPLGVWRPSAGRAHARPATRLPLFYFTVWLQRPWEAVGTPAPPPPSSLIMRSINVSCAAAPTSIIPLCSAASPLNNKHWGKNLIWRIAVPRFHFMLRLPSTTAGN